MEEGVVIYTDGGSRGNPGPAGAGAAIFNNGREVASVSEFLGTRTNNWAEYEALILALETARKVVPAIEGKTVSVRMDSELIVKQMKGEYRVKDEELKKQHARVKSVLTEHYGSVSFAHVRREKNERADELANEAMDRGA